MKNILSVENMRKSDAWTIANKTGSLQLMALAGQGVYDSVRWQGKIAVVCGTGNNGGDGYVIACLLKQNGYDVTLFLCKNKFSQDSLYYYQQSQKLGVPAYICDENVQFSQYDMIVDCIFGTGFNRQPEGIYKTVIDQINAAGKYVVSVDINSGLNGDTGLGQTVVKSDLTVAIQAFKPGHFLGEAKDVIKEKTACPIGIDPVEPPYHLIEESDLTSFFKERKNNSNKSTYGYIALIGGSKLYSGAIRLAYLANAAMRAGAGVVQVAVPDCISGLITSSILESTIYPLDDDGSSIIFNQEKIDRLIQKDKAIGFGMGIGISEGVKETLRYLLENYRGNLLIDADGLTCLSQLDEELIDNSPAHLILTPHTGEFARLLHCSTQEVLERPIDSAKQYAADHHLVVLLKGPTTIITDGTTVNLVDKGCPGMATAGSGDVLSGILTALAGYNEDTLMAATTAAYINGAAGQAAQEKMGAVSMIASDTVEQIPDVIKRLYRY